MSAEQQHVMQNLPKNCSKTMTTDPAKLIKFLSLQSLISNGQHVSSSYIQQRDRWSSVNDTLVAASNMKYSHIHDNGNIYCGPVICTFWHIQTKFLLSYSVMNSIYSMLRRKPFAKCFYSPSFYTNKRLFHQTSDKKRWAINNVNIRQWRFLCPNTGLFKRKWSLSHSWVHKSMAELCAP